MPRTDLRGRTHALYLDLASFTSAYLAHQDLEEREIMPALDQAIGFEQVPGDPLRHHREHPSRGSGAVGWPSCSRR